tara:strand:- start:1513 stop:1881 length:369 start_codon:yes stop_codon:yes gene_type:complete
LFNLFLVATGGATGAVLRYILTNLSKSLLSSSIYGTLSVNILGSFLIGYLITSIYVKNIPEDIIKFFLVIGLLGSFTTFSAFSFEVVNFITSKKIFFSFLYIFISITSCISFAYLGMIINKF